MADEGAPSKKARAAALGPVKENESQATESDKAGSLEESLEESLRRELIPVLAERVRQDPEFAGNAPEIAELSAGVAARVASTVIVQKSIVQRSHKGPLPPPDILAGYDKVVPGSAKRIVAMMAKEQSHRHRWETTALTASVKERKRRDFLSVAMTLGAVAAVSGLALALQSPWAGVAGIGVLVLGGGALLLGRKFLMNSDHGSVSISTDDEDQSDGESEPIEAGGQQQLPSPTATTDKPRKKRRES